MTPSEVCASLRQSALVLPPLNPSSPANRPYGFIVEFLQGETLVTLTAFESGDASMYLSSGGGVIGGIGNPPLAKLARSTVEALSPLVALLDRSDSTDLPRAGEYCFYVLTPAGRHVCRIHSTAKARADGPQVALIRLGGAVLTKIRETAGQS